MFGERWRSFSCFLFGRKGRRKEMLIFFLGRLYLVYNMIFIFRKEIFDKKVDYLFVYFLLREILWNFFGMEEGWR